MKLRLNLIFIIISLLLLSCVGTVKDTKKEKTKTAIDDNEILKFDGVSEVEAVSSSAVEVYFYPAAGETAKLNYKIFYDGSTGSENVPAHQLIPDYKGRLKYTVRNLIQAKKYTFNVQVQNTQTLGESANTSTKSTTTFKTETADFHGIKKVENLSGSNGLYALNVNWVLAESSGALPGLEKDGDPLFYEVVLLEASKLSPADFDNTTYGVADGRITQIVDSNQMNTTVNGLKSGTKYHVMVRCYNKLFVDNSNNPLYFKETNNEMITASTLVAGAAEVQFDSSTLDIRVPTDNTGRNTIHATWGNISGIIDHLRLYKNKVDKTFNKNTSVASSCVPLPDPNGISCHFINYSNTSFKVSDLETLEEYDFNLAICLDPTCSAGNRLFFDEVTQTIKPTNVSFPGILALNKPTSSTAIDEITFTITPPDITTGVVDGLLVQQNVGSTRIPLNSPDSSMPNPTNYKVLPFNYQTATEITVKGIEPASSSNLCFSVVPFIFSSDGSVNPDTSNEVIDCITPKKDGLLAQQNDFLITVPTAIQFSGLQNVTFSNSNNTLLLQWDKPSLGIYDRYVIFWKDRSVGSSFSFSDAVNGDSNYYMQTVGMDDKNTLLFLTAGQAISGKQYDIGILSNYSLFKFFYPSNNNLDGYSQPNAITTFTIP